MTHMQFESIDLIQLQISDNGHRRCSKFFAPELPENRGALASNTNFVFLNENVSIRKKFRQTEI